MSLSKNLLFIITGSIAAYKVAHVISHYRQQNYKIKVVATNAALNFLGISTIEGLTGEKVYTDMYANGSNMDHIHLVRWSDAIIVAPATANYLNKISNGIGDDLASTLFLAHDFSKPFLIFPAMNTKMFTHPSTQKSMTQLTSWGAKIFNSPEGNLACGENGLGRLLEPEEIIEKIASETSNTVVTKNKNASAKLFNNKILISSGGTQEPLDDVRVITNKSSGRTSAALADYLVSLGYAVTYLAAESAATPLEPCEVIRFKTFKDLSCSLESLLTTRQYLGFVHAAAVSDYTPLATTGKISSDQETITITLKKNPKLINLVKSYSPNIKLIGFKLTSTNDASVIKQKVEKLFTESNCDLVVHNDWSTVGSDQHIFNLHTQSSNLQNLTIADLATHLNDYFLKQENIKDNL